MGGVMENIGPYLSLISTGLMVIGGFFVIVGSVGMLRFPDFYSRLHAAGVTDTLGAELMLIGLMIQAGLGLVTVKLIMIIVFVFFTSPTSTHAIANAAYRAGLSPFTKDHSASQVREEDGDD